MLHDVVTILDQVFGSGKVFSRNEHYYSCPFCHHYKQKLAVNVAKGKWQCWKCGTRGGSLVLLLRKANADRSLIKQLRESVGNLEPESIIDEESTYIALPDEYVPLINVYTSSLYSDSVTYLNSRNISLNDILRYRIGVCLSGEYRGRIIIPSFNTHGSLDYFVGRTFTSWDKYLYKTPSLSKKHIVGFESEINWDYPLILSEGVFDAMAIKRNVIPLFGKFPSRRLKQRVIEEGVTDIYLALDSDALKESLKTAIEWINNGVNIHLVKLDGKDPSVIGFKKMCSLIEDAELLSF